MYYSYFDASGSRLRKDAEDFVLTSITIHESQRNHINEKINDIKKKMLLEYDPNDMELHVKDMLKRKGFFNKISTTQTYQLLDEIFEFLSKPETDFFIVSSLIKKDKMYDLVSIEEWAYKFVLERINEDIIFKNKQNNTSENCHLLIDNEGERNFEISSRIRWDLKYGTEYSKLESFDREISFLDSKDNNILQIVDCIVYAIRKYHRENKGNSRYSEKWKEYYHLIEPKFRNFDGQYIGVGLKIFPHANQFKKKTPILSGSFCKENKISQLTIIDEGLFIDTDFGRRIECTVICNDIEQSIRKWRITQKHWSYMFDTFGDDTIQWITKKISIEAKYMEWCKAHEIIIARME